MSEYAKSHARKSAPFFSFISLDFHRNYTKALYYINCDREEHKILRSFFIIAFIDKNYLPR